MLLENQLNVWLGQLLMMNRTSRMAFAVLLAGVVALALTGLAKEPAKPANKSITVPYNAEISTEQSVILQGSLVIPNLTVHSQAAVTLTTQGPSTVVFGALTLNGKFTFHGTIVVPKGAVLKQAPTSEPSNAVLNDKPVHQDFRAARFTH